VATWAEFEAAAPDVAAAGRRLLYRDGRGQAMLATVRGEDEPPRMNPITLAIVDGRVFAFILESPKLGDLERDGRYALHSHHDPAAPSEFALRGRARLVADAAVRAAAAAEWEFEVDDTYRLFEFSIDSALVGHRPTADDWPPKYTSWRSTPASKRR
jgi:pyridoxamine 5'-phosphate oxidase-like protein